MTTVSSKSNRSFSGVVSEKTATSGSNYSISSPPTNLNSGSITSGSTSRKILRIRPTIKSKEELDDEKMRYFQLPRKKCEQIIPEIPRLLNMGKTDQQHRLHVLKKIMKKARIKGIDDKMDHLMDFDLAERIIPHGEVSKRIYEDIFVRRDFDLYGHLMKPTVHPPRKHLELAVLASQLNIEFTQKLDERYKDDKPANAEDEDLFTESVRKRKLITEKWKIGQVDKYNPPVGLSANPSQPFHSLGNEYFYSYDGEWRGGTMNGRGTYLFKDGQTYEGFWKDGKQHGEGTATYPDGQTFTGQWRHGRYGGGDGECRYLSGAQYTGEHELGRRQGKGKLVYPSGLTYEGDFYDGKPHGRGKMVSALTGWSYEGSFNEGYISGSGTLFTPPPEKKRIVYYWAETKERVTLPSLVRHYLHEREEDLQQRERAQNEIYAPLRGAQLNAYVSQIRATLYADRMQEKKDLYQENVVKAREQRAKLYEARLKALAGEED